MTFTPSELETFDNIKKVFAKSYAEEALKNATKRQKFFCKLTTHPVYRYGARLLVGLPFLFALKDNMTAVIATAIGIVTLQNSLSKHFGILPIGDKAEENIKNDLSTGVLFDRYADALRQGDFGQKYPEIKIYTPEHELIRLTSLRNSFKKAQEQDNTDKRDALFDMAEQGNKTFNQHRNKGA